MHSKGEQVAAWSNFAADQDNESPFQPNTDKNEAQPSVKNQKKSEKEYQSLSKCEKFTLFLQRYVTSTMPYTQAWVMRQNILIQLLDAILRGVA